MLPIFGMEVTPYINAVRFEHTRKINVEFYPIHLYAEYDM